MKTNRVAFSVATSLLALAAYACGSSDPEPPPPVPDAGAHDASADANDAGPRPHEDGGPDASDAGVDATLDASPDTGADANGDAGADASSDANADAGADAGIDASADAGIDASGDTDAGIDASDDADAGFDAGPVGPTVMLLRVGDGTDLNSGNALPAFLEERGIADGRLVRTLPLPTKKAGDAYPVTFDLFPYGALARSVDGHYLITGGYGADVGTPNVRGSGTPRDGGPGVPRVIARIDKSGAIDSSTILGDQFDQCEVIGVASVDGTSFWATGDGNPFGAGQVSLVYLPFQSKGTYTPLLDIDTMVEHLEISGGNLYGTYSTYTPNGQGTVTGLGQIGTGLPTSSSAKMAMVLPVADPTKVVQGGFAFFDTDATAGPDLLYLANAVGTLDGGIQKWTLKNGAWTQVATIYPLGPTVSGSLRGADALVAIRANDGAVTLVVTVPDSSDALTVVAGVDDGSPSPAFHLVARAPSGTVYRGVALPPE